MTAPVVEDDIVSGAVKWLRAQPEAVAVVSSFVIDGVETAGIFQYRPWAKLEGTGKTAVVFSHEGGWTAANTHNSLRFPRLTMNVWADPLRDARNNVRYPGEVMRRVYACYKTFDSFLHRTGESEARWGTVRVISSVRLAEPVIYVVPDGDGLVRCLVNYAITEG